MCVPVRIPRTSVRVYSPHISFCMWPLCPTPRLQALFIPSIDGICAGFRDNSILVWDCYSYDVKARLQMPEDVTAPAIESIAASADGAYLACGTRNGSVLLWELVSQVRVHGCCFASCPGILDLFMFRC